MVEKEEVHTLEVSEIASPPGLSLSRATSVKNAGMMRIEGGWVDLGKPGSDTHFFLSQDSVFSVTCGQSLNFMHLIDEGGGRGWAGSSLVCLL